MEPPATPLHLDLVRISDVWMLENFSFIALNQETLPKSCLIYLVVTDYDFLCFSELNFVFKKEMLSD